MNKMTAAVLWLTLVGSAAAQTSHDELLGLWEVSAVKDLTTGSVEEPRREYHMFTRSHEMIVLAGSDRKKIKKSLSDMTSQEVMSQQPIGAGFYRYEVQGEKLIRTNVLALSAYYEGSTFETEFRVEGDTLVTRDRHAADGHLREWRMRRVE